MISIGRIVGALGWIAGTVLMLLLSGCEHTPPSGGGEGDAHVFEVKIEMSHNSLQGLHEIIDVTLERGYYRLSSFDLKIAHYANALSFQGAIPGPLFTECHWEYFNYQFSFRQSCDGMSPCGLVDLVAIADINFGRPRVSDADCPQELMDDGPVVLFSLDYLVSSDRQFDCAYLPIRFYWEDCDDNVIAYRSGWNPDTDITAVSMEVLDFGRIGDDQVGFPTFQGYQQECFTAELNHQSQPVPLVSFSNGGVDIVCVGGPDYRGDINLNGIVNEIADALMFRDYFLYGTDVFQINYAGQIAASDINADGITLSLSDFVYQIRIIVGDASPYPILQPVPGTVTESSGRLAIDRQAGAAHLVVHGNGLPTLLADNMDMDYAFDGLATRILIYRIGANASFSDEFIEVDGNIMSLDMATYDGTKIDVTIVSE
ncbi:MAG: hypothetical protein OEV49_13680 [candidate division Zixibacteria bacterium]|nr:hypothetical protein [candidate division Zixibacteria bacterium]MDH3937122.1 hypothetical protein [candidate division Zixibacteria bacterium]MDH4034597.1 hypothetical protein [candidate division Zixibacteria bacterium]